MTQDIKDVLKLALEGVEIHSPNSPEYIVCAALIEALRENAMREVQRLGQEIEQEPVANVKFMRQVLSVAIAVLYEHYKDDVLRVFTLDDLQTVIDLSDSLRPQQVEDIYKRAWDILEVATLPQRTEQEPWCMKMNGCKTKCEDCPVEVVEPEPEQEPVAHCEAGPEYCPVCNTELNQEPAIYPEEAYEMGLEEIAFYTAPPRRTWVGLTDEQITQVIKSMPRGIKGWMSDWDLYEFSKAIEAKLKENT